MAHEIVRQQTGPVLPVRPGEGVRETIRTACQQLYTVEGEFVSSFRSSLTQLVPELQHTAEDNGRTIADCLARTVLWAGLTTDHPDVVEETLQNVGEEYQRHGFPLWGYHGAGRALLRTARDIQIHEWTSQLSSAWVAYFAWMTGHLTIGFQRSDTQQVGPQAGAQQTADDVVTRSTIPTILATEAPTRSRHLAPSTDGASPTTVDLSSRTGLTTPTSLDEVLDLLRSKYFTGSERTLGLALARVATRTGADLRSPRPDHRRNPAVIANVIAVLQSMGYDLLPNSSETAQHATAPSPQPSMNGHWWNRRRPSSTGFEWNQSVPGTLH
jgi:hemoglobin-like flavoprotein